MIRPMSAAPRPHRRGFLCGAALAAAGLLVGCPRRATPPAVGSSGLVVDDSFARLALAHLAGDDATSALLEHPALEALARHQAMTGVPSSTPAELLARVLDRVDVEGAATVLEAWSARPGGLEQAASDALRLLPAGVQLSGRILLGVGYDIGVAAPPDVYLNLAHPHFVQAPEELPLYATHEAHHVGFLQRRTMPALERLEEPPVLREIVSFFTQLEGMAVHAALEPRRAAGLLDGDPDYAVYDDASVATAVIEAYRQQLALLEVEGRLHGSTIGQVLGRMSAMERLWYRFGALVCARIEERQGRAALVATIDEPGPFEAAARELLAST